MKMNEFARQQVLICLRELSDPEFQERVWLRGEGPEVSSPAELISQLYDDTALGELLDTSETEPVFSRDADTILIELSLLLDEIDPYMDIAELLHHPKWAKVRALAARAAELVEASS